MRLLSGRVRVRDYLLKNLNPDTTAMRLIKCWVLEIDKLASGDIAEEAVAQVVNISPLAEICFIEPGVVFQFCKCRHDMFISGLQTIAHKQPRGIIV